MQIQQRQHLAIFGVLRAHGGKIDEENRCRSPGSGSTRLSLTPGTITGTDPALVSTSRGSWQPVRTTSRCPFSSPNIDEQGDVGVDLRPQGLGHC